MYSDNDIEINDDTSLALDRITAAIFELSTGSRRFFVSRNPATDSPASSTSREWHRRCSLRQPFHYSHLHRSDTDARPETAQDSRDNRKDMLPRGYRRHGC
jgi:hypothetical protein